MKFGFQQLYEKTPKLMVRIGLACKAMSASAVPSIVNGSKIAIIVAMVGLIGAFLVAFFGESNDDNNTKPAT
jgi:hypothetical protein